MNLSKRKDGIPVKESYPSLTDSKMADLIKRYRAQRRKERMAGFLGKSSKQLTKEDMKQALPKVSSALDDALKTSHKINPANRQRLSKVTHHIFNDGSV